MIALSPMCETYPITLYCFRFIDKLSALERIYYKVVHIHINIEWTTQFVENRKKELNLIVRTIEDTSSSNSTPDVASFTAKKEW